MPWSAVVSLAESLHAELAESGSQVRVHRPCPGMVATNIGEAECNRPKQLQSEPAALAAESPAAGTIMDPYFPK